MCLIIRYCFFHVFILHISQVKVVRVEYEQRVALFGKRTELFTKNCLQNQSNLFKAIFTQLDCFGSTKAYDRFFPLKITFEN